MYKLKNRVGQNKPIHRNQNKKIMEYERVKNDILKSGRIFIRFAAVFFVAIFVFVVLPYIIKGQFFSAHAAQATTTFMEAGTDATNDTTFYTTTGTAPTSSTTQFHGSPRSLKINAGSLGGVIKSGILADAGRRISMWVYSEASVSQPLFRIQQPGGNSEATVSIWSDDTVKFTYGLSNTQVAGSNTITSGAWHQVVMAYKITSTTVNEFRIYVDGNLEISLTNITLSSTVYTDLVIGHPNSAGGAGAQYIDDVYVDDSNALTYPGDIRVTAKLPTTVSSNAWDTTGGTGAVNERGIGTANYKAHASSAAATQTYQIQAAAIGDVDISSYTYVAGTTWVWAKRGSGGAGTPYIKPCYTGVSDITPALDATTAALFTLTTDSTSYPTLYNAGCVGMQSTGAGADTFMYEAGMLIAYQVPSAITISGTCDGYDQTTDCGDTGTIQVAVNGVLNSSQTQTTVAGTWSITNFPKPATNAIITVLVVGAGDTDEAIAVTKYGGSGDITGIKLFKEHLTIGSNQNTTVTNSDVNQYDFSNGEDGLVEGAMSNSTCGGVASFTGLCVEKNSVTHQERIYIDSGDTFAPGGNVVTIRLDVRGTYTGAAGETLYFNGSQSSTSTTCGNTSQMPLCVNGGTFTAPATTKFIGGAAATIYAGTYTGLEISPSANSITATLGAGTFAASGNITFGNGTNTSVIVEGTTNNPTITTSGASSVLTVSANTTFQSGSGTITLSGNGTPLVTTGTFTASTSNTVSYTNTTSANVTRTTYYNLDFSPASGTPTYTMLGGGTATINNNLVLGGAGNETVTITTNDPVVSVTGNVTIGSGDTLIASDSGLLSVGGNWTTTGTFTHSNGTVKFTSTSSGKTINPGSSSFYNVILDGVSGVWSALTNTLTVANDLTVTNGTLDNSSGSASITVNGHVACGATCGTINLSSGTFTQSVGASAKNFGTNVAVSTNWAFNNLTFTASTQTITASSTGTGTITVAGTLTISASTTLNAGNRTWILSAVSTPFTKTGTFNADTSTFKYTGGTSGTPTVPTAATYNNLEVSPANNSGVANFGSGSFVVGGTLTIGNGTNTSVSVSLDTNDPTMDVNGSVSISANTTLVASASAAFTIATNFTNSGAFTHSSGTVTFDSANTATIAGNNTIFHNLTINPAGSAKTVKFTATETYRVNGLLTITGTLANNVTIQSTTTGTTNTQWLINHQGTESVTYATFYDSGCDGSSTEIYLVGGNNTNGARNGTCWSFVDMVTVSGTIYTDEGTAAYDCSGGNVTIQVKINGAGSNSTTCTVAGGTYSVTGITGVAAGNVVTIFIDGASINANRITRAAAASGTITANLYQNRVILSHEDAGPITSANLGVYDDADAGSDGDVMFTIGASDSATFNDVAKVIVWAGKTWTTGAGGTILSQASSAASTDGDLLIQAGAVLDSTGRSIFIGGDFTNSGTYTHGNSAFFNLWGLTDTFTIDIGSSTFDNFTVHSSATGTFNLTAATTTIGDNFQISGATSTITSSNTIVATGSVTGGGIISMAAGSTFEMRAPSNITFGTTTGSNAWTFNNLTFSRSSGTPTITTNTSGTGAININGTLLVSKTGDGAGTILDAGNRTWNLSNSNSSDPFNMDQASGSLTGNTSTFVFNGDNDSGDVTVENATYTHLTLGGAVAENYVPEGTITMSGDLSMAANGTLSGTASITVSGGDVTGTGDINMTGGTFLVDGAGNFGSTTSWDFYNLSFGDGSGATATTAASTSTIVVTNDFTIAANQTLNAGSKIWTLSKNGTPFTKTGTFNTDTSTFKYTGGTSGTPTVVTAATYNNLEVSPANNSGTANFAAGAFAVGGDLTIGNGTNTSVSVSLDTNDPTMDINGSLSISASTALVASASAAFTIGTNFTKNATGTFTHSSGTVTFDSGAIATIAGDGTIFHNLTINPGGAAKTVKFTAAETYRVNGLLTITGTMANNVTIQSTTTGAANTQWLMNHQGTEAVTYATFYDSGCDGSSTEIDVSDGTNTSGARNGTCWAFVATLAINGTVYSNEGSSAITNGPTIRVKKNGAGDYSATANGSGVFNVTGLTSVSAGDVITVYIDGATPNANTIAITNVVSGTLSGINLYQDRIILRNEHTGNITNTTLNNFDNACNGGTGDSDGDLLFCVDSGNLTVSDGAKLLLWTGDTYQPGGTITTSPSSSSSSTDGDFEIQGSAILQMGTNALSVGGDFTNGGGVEHGSQTTTFTATATGHAIEDNNAPFDNVVFNGSGGDWVFSSAVDILGDLTMTAGTLSGTSSVTVNGDVTGNGTINLTGGTFTIIGSGMNVAAAANGGTATASSETYPATAATNGARDSFYGAGWGTVDGGWNDATNLTYPDWLQVEFGGTYSIGEIDVITLKDAFTAYGYPTLADTFASYGIVDFEVQYWNGSSWVAVTGGTVTGNNKVWRRFTFSPVMTTKIRVYVTAGLTQYSRIVEVEAYTSIINFGGDTAWNFNNLSFGDGSAYSTVTATGTGAVGVAGALTVAANQALDAGSKTWTLSGTTGTPLTVGGTFTPGTSTVAFTGNNSGGNTTVRALTYNNLQVNNASETYRVEAGTLTVNDDLTVTAGTLDLGTNNPTTLVTGSLINSGTLSAPTTLTVVDTLTNNGTFTANSGTVVMQPAAGGISIVNGSANITFNNFTSLIPDTTIKFAAGRTYGFDGTLNVEGDDSGLVRLLSTSNGDQWFITMTGTAELSYIGVRDSGCSGGNPISTSHSNINNGNNGTCWSFILRGGGSGNGPSGGGSGGGTPPGGGTGLGGDDDEGESGGSEGGSGGGQPPGGGGGVGGGGGGASPQRIVNLRFTKLPRVPLCMQRGTLFL